MEISGHTQMLCLIGSPVGHSGSPAMYNYSFERTGLDNAYLAFDIPLEKVEEAGIRIAPADIHIALSDKEQDLIKSISKLPAVVKEAGENYSPALLGNYAYELAKEFNQFYHDFSILKEEDVTVRNFRLLLAKECSEAIKNAMGMLGIEMPERM